MAFCRSFNMICVLQNFFPCMTVGQLSKDLAHITTDACGIELIGQGSKTIKATHPHRDWLHQSTFVKLFYCIYDAQRTIESQAEWCSGNSGDSHFGEVGEGDYGKLLTSACTFLMHFSCLCTFVRNGSSADRRYSASDLS
ncbi:hypothetical protein D915_007012 [Fasciola hepatica]|uniref:Uncharacterized protein n=1 Tax=Fasciola hepatica TaxID=6192 RepID=A0A4E0R420_FASHE|nr:hypothetical protein D915_007012 [Fasciola hepatica]